MGARSSVGKTAKPAADRTPKLSTIRTLCADEAAAKGKATKTIRMKQTERGGFVNLLGASVLPGQEVVCSEPVAKELLKSGVFEAASAESDVGAPKGKAGGR